MYKGIERIWLTVFDGEGDPPKGDPPKGDPPKGDPPKGDPSTGGGKTFTQEELNRILAEDRRKNQQETRKAIEELQALQTKLELTDAEKRELAERIDSLNNTLLTEQEKLKREKERAEKEYQTEKERLLSERDFWQKNYTEETIIRSLKDAAAIKEHEAQNPEHIVALLKPNTRLVEELHDGKPTGKYTPKVKFATIDKDGNSITLDLAPQEAVKRLSEMPEHFPLFKGKGSGGAGSDNGGRGGELSAAEIAKRNPAEFVKMRREGKLKI